VTLALIVFVSIAYSAVGLAASRTARSASPRTTASVSRDAGRFNTVHRPAAAARPDDPPIGVSIQTLSSDPGSAILIDGRGLPNVADRNGIHIVVLSAATRERLESGTAPRNGGGLNLLTAIARKWASQHPLVIVSAAHGVNASDKSALDALTKQLGATPFTGTERGRLAAGSPFSIIGYPGGAAGTAWTKVAPDLGGSGDITGWLQFNHATGEYGYVSGHDVTFDTSVPGGPADGNTIGVDGHRYSGQLPANYHTGFEILSLNSQTLAERSLDFVQTENEPGSEKLAQDLETASSPSSPNDPAPLVFVQSIGRPVGGRGGFWPKAADVIKKLGGSPLAFLNLLGHSDYTLVGSTDAGPAAAEAGTILGAPGPESGVLAPGQNLSFLPVAAGPTGGINLQLVKLEYQAPEAWPAINAAAENSIGQQVRLCGPSSSSCDFRSKFGSDYQAAWPQIHTDINTASVMAPHSGPGFTDDEYQATRARLSTELSMFSQVKNYFTVLHDAFGASSQDRRVDVKQIGDQVYADVSPPPADKTSAFALGLVSNILKLGAFAGPPVSAITSGLSGVFALSAFLAGRAAPDSSLADQVKVRSDELAKQSQAQISDAIDGLTTQARIVVTDWGKLRAASRYISDGDWRLPTDPKDYVPTLQRSVKQWFAESLVSTAYPWLIRTQPLPPLGPTNANNLVCLGHEAFGYPKEAPWGKEPASAQMRAVESWKPDGSPIDPVFFISRWAPPTTWNSGSISQKLADMMFGHGRDELAVNLYQFLSPRWFEGIHTAIQLRIHCALR
jgi:hypothetical protein